VIDGHGTIRLLIAHAHRAANLTLAALESSGGHAASQQIARALKYVTFTAEFGIMSGLGSGGRSNR